LLVLLVGLDVQAAGIIRDRVDVALPGVAVWTASVVLGLLMQRMEPR
jgi:hypothetical protein